MSNVIDFEDYTPRVLLTDPLDKSVHVAPVRMLEFFAKSADFNHLTCDEKDSFIRMMSAALMDFINEMENK